MSEYQFTVSLFDKKFIPEEMVEESDHNDHNTSSSSTLSSSPPTNLITQSRSLLSGKQFWPTSKAIRDDYTTSNNSPFGSRPIKKIFNKIWNKMNPNESLKRKFSPNDSSPPSAPSEENSDDFHLNQHNNYHNEHLRIHKKTSSLTRERRIIHKKQSTNKLRKKRSPQPTTSTPSTPNLTPAETSTSSKLQPHLNYLCYDDMFNKRNPISPPINPVAISRNQSVSYAPRHNLNPLFTPDERTSRPLRSVRFNIHIYWQKSPTNYQIELPRNISFHRFKRVISQMLRCEIPNDLIVLYHTKRYSDDDVMIRSDYNEKINWLLLDYLCKSDKIRVVTHDAIWSIYLLMWNDDISVTLFSTSLNN